MQKKGKIITVTSVKGGTGKTTTVLNIAGALHNKEKRTIILDLDLTSGVISPILNITSPQNICIAAEDIENGRFESVEKYTKKYNEHIDIIPSSLDPRSALNVNPKCIEKIINDLVYQYDYILIDTSHVINELNITVFDISDYLLYVISDDLMDIKNMKTMISIFNNIETDKYKIILNHALVNSIGNYEISSALGKTVDFIIPKEAYEKKIQKYNYNGQIITIEKPKMSKIYEGLIDKVIK